MIYSFAEIPTTETSKPFSSAVERCGLASSGYVEKEYLMNGTANVYGTDCCNRPVVLYPDCDYTNRVIVRMPVSPAKFNGHVVVEILNATALFDIERMWIASHKQLVRSGAIYIGITSKPDVFDTLSAYDTVRYGSLCWRNPRTEAEWQEPDHKLELTFRRKQDECGLIWDMLTDLAVLLKSSSTLSPLHGYATPKVTLTGWSQSGCYLLRYLNSFVYPAAGESNSAYDGYLLAGTVHSINVPLNQCEYGQAIDATTNQLSRMDKPCILLQTESENAWFGGADLMLKELSAQWQCRLYDIAGATHDTADTLIHYYGDDEEMRRIGCLPTYHGRHKHPNNFPYAYVFHAAFRNLFHWMDTGVAPAATPRIAISSDLSNQLDIFGNALGGLRTPFVDLPIGRFIPWSEESHGRNILFGHFEPFSPAFLMELYQSLGHYRNAACRNIAQRVAEGMLLHEDAEAILLDAVQMAEEHGLSE